MIYKIKSLTVFFRALSVTFGQNPGRTAIWLFLLVIRALSIPLIVWLTGYIIQVVTSTEPLDTAQCVLMAFLWLISLTIGSALAPWLGYLNDAIGDESMAEIQQQIIVALGRVPDLMMLENKDFYDDVALTERHLENTPANFVFQCEVTLESLISILALGFLIGQISWVIVFIILISFVPHAWMMNHLSKKNYFNSKSSVTEWKEIQYCTASVGSISVGQEMRTLGNAKFLANKADYFFSKLNTILHKARLKATAYPIPTLLFQQLGSVLSLLILLQAFKSGIVGAAEIVIVLQCLLRLQRSFESVAQTYSLIIWNIHNFMPIFRVLDIKPSIQLASNPLSIGISEEVEIRFDNVSFSYPGGPLVLKNITFIWRSGEKIALVGDNGGGKSTIIKLLLRFYDPNSGVIYVNNRPLADYDIEQWRKLIAPVFQDFGRYEYSIRENIYFTKSDASSENLQAVLKDCGLAELVNGFPDGVETRLGKRFGITDLSGGQWQKLAIARAVCKPSSIMILDEPTAALDPNMESDIYQLFKKLSEGKSLFMTTHRLGSAKMADVILVLSEGCIVERGSHEELIKLDRIYAKMFKAQSEWYQRPNILEVHNQAEP